MKDSKKGLSIIFTMIFVILITFLVLYILEYMIPFGREVKGIEHSSKAYYEANKGVEDSLFYAKENKLTNGATSSGNYEYNLKAITDATNTTIPFLGKGNSEYDTNFNTVSFGNPVQMEIGDGAIAGFGGVNLNIRAPNIDGGGNNIFTGSTVLVTWRLTSTGGVLAGNLTATSPTEVYNGNLGALSGKELDSTVNTLGAYYAANCGGGEQCALKLSVVNDFKSASGTTLPYLEWNVDFNGNIVPTRFFRVNASGESGPFKKHLEVQKPQQTVIEAFDFTIIQ